LPAPGTISMADMVPGGEFEQPGLWSWSRDKTTAIDFGRVVMTVKKKNSFELSEDYFPDVKEQEHVLPKSVRYRVLSVRKGQPSQFSEEKILVELEEL